MKTIFQAGINICLLIVLCFTAACNKSGSKVDTSINEINIYDGVEFNMPKVHEPIFQDYTISVKEFGAVSGGQILNTKAFGDAINHVAEKGGGKVVIPRGTWLTGPIVLKSNINLHLESGALLIFSDNKDLYPLIEASFEGLNTVRCQSPISGKNLENVAITGDGVIDGSGDVWRHVKREKLTKGHWEKLVNSGGVLDDNGKIWYPSLSYKEGIESSSMNVPTHLTKIEEFVPIRDFLRPVMISLVSCDKVLLEGPVFQNSPSWNIHPLMCTNLTVRNIDVRNPWYSQNGDGIDIESCKNVLLYNSTFDVGDDAICIKSGKDKEGRDRGIATENLIVKNCLVYHGHGGISVGSEMSGGVKNMHVSNCTFLGTDVGLRFKSNRGRGGIVEGIYISDIEMVNIPTNAISFNLYYEGLSVSEMLQRTESNAKPEVIFPVTEETPQFKNISLKNINCKGALQAIYLQGLPEMSIENIRLENINMVAKKGLFGKDIDGITMKNITLKIEEFPALSFINSKKVDVEGLVVTNEKAPLISVGGKKSENISIGVKTDLELSEIIGLGKGVNKEVVKLVKN